MEEISRSKFWETILISKHLNRISISPFSICREEQFTKEFVGKEPILLSETEHFERPTMQKNITV